MTLPIGPKQELEDLIKMAESQNRLWLAARLRSILAQVEELEAEIALIEDGHRRAGEARVQQQTAEERKAWSEQAHRKRWCQRAGIDQPNIFTS